MSKSDEITLSEMVRKRDLVGVSLSDTWRRGSCAYSSAVFAWDTLADVTRRQAQGCLLWDFVMKSISWNE